MATYYNQEVRVRGRLLSVSFRYGSYNGASVKKGKPLKITKDVRARIMKALNRPHKERERYEIHEALSRMDE